jgi:hypothetical protein
MSRELAGDGHLVARYIEIIRAQNRNYALAEGFHRMTLQPANTWSLFLPYQAQAERHYRRAVEEFDRRKALRAELPNEPILEVPPQENKTACAPPDEPTSTQPPSIRLPAGLRGGAAPCAAQSAVASRPGSVHKDILAPKTRFPHVPDLTLRPKSCSLNYLGDT